MNMERYKVLINCFAGIGFLVFIAVICLFLSAIFSDDEHKAGVSDEKTSPNGDFVVTTHSGLAGIASSCHQVVSVLPMGTAYTYKTIYKFKVVDVDCDAKVNYEWLSDTILQVTLFDNENDQNVSIFLKQIDESKSIKIQFKFIGFS